MKLQYLEAFYSIQGEGMRVGCPSVFLRTFGCNFRCQNFGVPESNINVTTYEKVNVTTYEKVKVVSTYQDVDPLLYTSVTDLPLVKTGCDSYAAWDVRCKHLVKKEEPVDLASTLTKLTPNGNWDSIDLVITGGEPLLGWQKFYPELLGLLNTRGLKNVTFETNTTQELHPLLMGFIKDFDGEVTFSCSPKLAVSGEQREDAICPEIARTYTNFATGGMYFKFVVGSGQDLTEVEEVINTYKSAGVDVPIYLMPVGGCYKEYKENSRVVAKLALSRGWRYSPRLHTDLFGNAWAT